jgi:hypothetical protein
LPNLSDGHIPCSAGGSRLGAIGKENILNEFQLVDTVKQRVRKTPGELRLF